MSTLQKVNCIILKENQKKYFLAGKKPDYSLAYENYQKNNSLLTQCI